VLDGLGAGNGWTDSAGEGCNLGWSETSAMGWTKGATVGPSGGGKIEAVIGRETVRVS